MDDGLVHSERVLRMTYTNYRGERAMRRVVPERVWFGATDWHPTAQWLLDAFDLDRNACRSFALQDVESFMPDTEEHVPHRSGDSGAPSGLQLHR